VGLAVTATVTGLLIRREREFLTHPSVSRCRTASSVPVRRESLEPVHALVCALISPPLPSALLCSIYNIIHANILRKSPPPRTIPQLLPITPLHPSTPAPIPATLLIARIAYPIPPNGTAAVLTTTRKNRIVSTGMIRYEHQAPPRPARDEAFHPIYPLRSVMDLRGGGL
jgi:hypothetical protein